MTSQTTNMKVNGKLMIAACSLGVLLISASAQRLQETGGRVVARRGDDVRLSWDLPSSLREQSLLLVCRDRPSVLLFITTTNTTAPNSPYVDSNYTHRVQVEDTMKEGRVQFTLSNVTLQDGGRYICTKGPTEADVVQQCGTSLVVLDAPTSPQISVNGTILTGTDVILRCTASSVSSPRDHEQPMRYRWYETRPTDPTAWTEIQSHGMVNIQQLQEVDDTGSGESETEAIKESDWQGSLSNVMRIKSLAREDEGRRIVCSASQGLGLWSERSEPFDIRPHWKPSPSDMTLTPAGHSLTLTSGDVMKVTCQAVCRPECSVVWKQMTSDQQSVTLLRGMTLHMDGVTSEQTGVYRCEASNSHGSAFLSLSLHVQEREKPWYRKHGYVIAIVAIVTAGLVACTIGVAVVVYKCRQRSSPFRWPQHQHHQDSVPLNPLNHRPSLLSN